MLTDDAKLLLEALPENRVVVWCELCGHIHAAGALLQRGSLECDRTIASGTPAECIEAMSD